MRRFQIALFKPSVRLFQPPLPGMTALSLYPNSHSIASGTVSWRIVSLITPESNSFLTKAQQTAFLLTGCR